MTDLLTVRGLCKEYPGFRLDRASFSLPEGKIMGFIGRNGAGKTTTLSCLLDLVHPTAGEIRFFGLPFEQNQWEIKQQLGFVSGSFDFYPRKRLSAITQVTRRFYRDWDDALYRRYLSLFQLAESKTPTELSAGMRVKYSLALALSHKARLLLLDEPTSGLDPVSREELLDVFLELVREENVSILFSTHITSDLEKCADLITYIREGKIPFSGSMEEFLGRYRLLRFPGEESPGALPGLIGLKPEKTGFSALLEQGAPVPAGAEVLPVTLDSIIVHLEHKEVPHEKPAV